MPGLSYSLPAWACKTGAKLAKIPGTPCFGCYAMKGNYNDAISNAIGSNVFDIGFALGFPILMFSVFYNPIFLTQNIQNFSLKIMFVLLALTVLTFIILISNKKIGLSRGILLLILYIFFIVYVLLS